MDNRLRYGPRLCFFALKPIGDEDDRGKESLTYSLDAPQKLWPVALRPPFSPGWSLSPEDYAKSPLKQVVSKQSAVVRRASAAIR